MKIRPTQPAVASLLGLPIYLALARIEPLQRWFLSGAGWSALEPLFRVCRAIGIRNDGRVLMALMLALAWLLAVLLVASTARLWHLRRRRKA